MFLKETLKTEISPLQAFTNMERITRMIFISKYEYGGGWGLGNSRKILSEMGGRVKIVEPRLRHVLLNW